MISNVSTRPSVCTNQVFLATHCRFGNVATILQSLGRPHHDKNTLGTDQYRTIFVGRLSYETTEERLKKEFHGVFGEVVNVHIVKDSKTGKSRGYGFVEFSDDREADGK
jgi:hypothetical protein